MADHLKRARYRQSPRARSSGGGQQARVGHLVSRTAQDGVLVSSSLTPSTTQGRALAYRTRTQCAHPGRAVTRPCRIPRRDRHGLALLPSRGTTLTRGERARKSMEHWVEQARTTTDQDHAATHTSLHAAAHVALGMHCPRRARTHAGATRLGAGGAHDGTSHAPMPRLPPASPRRHHPMPRAHRRLRGQAAQQRQARVRQQAPTPTPRPHPHRPSG